MPISFSSHTVPVTAASRRSRNSKNGELSIAPAYAGPAPGYPGLDQINFRLPPDVTAPGGCYVSLIAASFSFGVAPGPILDIQLLTARIINVDPSRASVQVRPAGSSTTLTAPLLAAGMHCGPR
jgi:hypothetical protein